MRDETTFNFSGPFRDVMPLYIKYRRSLGYKVAESELYRMKELDVFFERHGITEPCISREMYDKWTSLRDGQRPVTICKRQAFIRGWGGICPHPVIRMSIQVKTINAALKAIISLMYLPWLK